MRATHKKGDPGKLGETRTQHITRATCTKNEATKGEGQKKTVSGQGAKGAVKSNPQKGKAVSRQKMKGLRKGGTTPAEK